MRKIMFFLLFSMSLFSCSSSDDNKEQPQGTKELHLIMNPTAVTVNHPIYFTILDDDKQGVEADLYVGNTKVNNPIFFNQVGKYTVKAKKGGYLDSNSLEVNVLKQRRKNKFELNSLKLEIESVTLSVEQVKVLNQGKEQIVDKVIKWSNGDLGNVYNLEFKTRTIGKQGRVEVSYFVPNSSIVADNDKVISYGERRLPNEVEEVFYLESWIVTDNYDNSKNWKTAKAGLELDDVNIPNRGEGVGPMGIDAIAYIKINYTDGDTVLNIVYDGEIRFVENVDDKINGEYLPIVLKR